MADRVYTKEDLQKYMDAMNNAANATDNIKNFMTIQAFAEEDLLSFVNGNIDITPDSFDKMKEFIETFAGGYSDERIKKLYDQAMAKLNSRIEEEKTRLASESRDNGDNNNGAQSDGASDKPTGSESAGNDDDNHDKGTTPQVMEEVIEGRLRSPYSDINDFYLDSFKLEVLHDMGKISDADLQDAQNAGTAAKAIEYLNKVEPQLKEDEKQDMENRLTDKILSYPDAFELMPPKRLALMYDNVKDRYGATQDPAERQKLGQAYKKLGDRIDELTDMIVKKQHSNPDLFFADVTNIADCHEGYMQMFDARKPDLAAMAKNPSTKASAQTKLDKITEATQILDTHLTTGKDSYDKTWNLDGVSADNAPELNERFDEINSQMKQVEIDEQTLALVSNMKFLDENGNTLPQFIDAKGNKTDAYSQGARIIEGSKLEEAVLLENLNSGADITPDMLSQAVSDALPETLYAIHVADKTANGALEKPDQFTNQNNLNAFMAELADVSKPMPITHKGFEAAKNALVNQTGAYASRLAQKVGKDKAVVSKLFKPIEKLDGRAQGRTEKMNPWKARGILAKRLAVGGASAFGISFALTTLGTAAATDATLTAATGGLNKFAGAALGIGLGTVATITTIHKWRKAQKAQGQKAGLKEFVRNPQLVAALATTAMGAAAVGFAATGNPGVASALGIGAMTIGTTNGIVSNVARAKEMGLSTTEAAAWGAAQGVVNVAAGFGGRAAGMGFVDYINNNTDLNWFKHEETIVRPGPSTTREVPDLEALEADSARYNQQYNIADRVHPGLTHEQYMQAVADYNAAHPGAEITHPDNLLQHAYNAKVLYGQGYRADNGISAADVSALRGLINPDGSINPAAVQSYNDNNFILRAGLQNFVGKVSDPNIDLRPDLYPTKDPHSTYSDMNIPTKTETVRGPDVTITEVIPNDKTPMVGMLGTYMPKFFGKLKPREGSLLDRIVKKTFRKPKKVKKPYIPPQTTVVDVGGKKPYVPPKVTVIDPPVVVIDPPEKKLMIDEYKIDYGTEPKQESYDAYYARVEKERVKEAPDLSMYDYLLLRRKQLDEFVDSKLGVLKEEELGNAFPRVKCKADYMRRAVQDTRAGAVIIGKARESLMQSNLTHENFTGAITLTHFKKYLDHYIAQDVMVADGTRDFSQNPTLKTNGDRIEIYDLNAYLVEGKSKGESNIEGRDGASIPLADIKILRQRTKQEIEENIHPRLDLDAIKNREKRLGQLKKEQAERERDRRTAGRE